MRSSKQPHLVAGLLAAVLHAPAYAAPDKIYSPVVEAHVTEIEYRAWRDFDDRDEVDRSQKHRFGVGHGFTDYWFTELYAVSEKEGGNALKVEAVEWENLFQLTPQGKYWADFGVLIEYEHSVRGGPGEIKVAPLIEKELTDRLVATANLIFEVQTGSGRESGTTFAYAARLRYALDRLYEPAIEFIGEPGRINHFPDSNEQEHWIGPALYGKVRTAPGQSLSYSGSALIGVTDAASDVRAVLRLEYEF